MRVPRSRPNQRLSKQFSNHREAFAAGRDGIFLSFVLLIIL